ncbi:MAG TPA: DUF3034 family protein [Stellaceae bacterium]|jgi:hypothetical protein|nr:DUF3034 family protein [Stellaceae bacterium]
MRRSALAAVALAMATTTGGPALAQELAPPEDFFDSGKLLATSGLSQIEGAGGGGLTPWAVITGYETRDAIGANAHYTFVNTPSFTLHSAGAAVGFYDRFELSYAREIFDTRSTGARLGLGSGYTFNEDIFGAKLRIAGDAVYDQDSWMPQIAIGTQYKRNDNAATVHAIGAKSAQGWDFYASATKLFLAESVLLDATVRATRANQLGILGFGGDRDDNYNAEFEGSAAYLLTRKLAIGVEYRGQPNNLSFAAQDRWIDAFIAYFPTRNLSLTMAAVDLGSIAGQKRQRGIYLSMQAGF